MEEETNVVYKFKCSVGACEHRNNIYIGLTTTTLRRRMLAHRNHGGINSHFTSEHDRKPLLTELLENTTIVHREDHVARLNIAEAVSIAMNHPSLNVQTESDYVLPSARRRATTVRNTVTSVTEEDVTTNEPTATPAGEAARDVTSTTEERPRRQLRPRRDRPSYVE